LLASVMDGLWPCV